MLSKLSQRDRMVLLVGAALALFLLVGNYVVWPVLDELAENSGAVQQDEIELQRDQHLLAHAAVEETRVAAASDHLKELEAGLLEGASPSLANAEWQHVVNQLADSKGITLGSSEFLRVQDLGAGYSLVTGRLQFHCRLNQLVDFLVGMAASPKLLSVTHLVVTASQGDPQGLLNVELTVGAAARTMKQAKDESAKQD
jgi:hypothetical protein